MRSNPLHTPLKIGSVCTGYGGLDMAVQAVFGGRLAWWSDIEPGPIKVMEAHHPDVPNIGDIKTADWSQVPPVDILTAGYPCQPFSNAGKRLGTEDPRHLWPHINAAIGVLRPGIIVLENVAAHARRGFDIVTAGLSALGYRVGWTIVRASDASAPHKRERLFVLATRECGTSSSHPGRNTRQEDDQDQPATAGGGGIAADPEGERRDQRRPEYAGLVGESNAPSDSGASVQRWGKYADAIYRWQRVLGRAAPDPTVEGARGGQVLSPFLVEWMMGLPQGHVTGVAGLSRNQMLRLLGNGVVPQQAEKAIRYLWPFLQDEFLLAV
jgi:DNA (cytosine-5)-methyltransferase 1